MDRLAFVVAFGVTIAVIVGNEIRHLIHRPFANPELVRRARINDTHRRNPHVFD